MAMDGKPTADADKLAVLEAEINRMHEALENTGMNSKGVTDVFGRPFSLPVDSEHKAKKLGLTQICCNISNPHMRAFHTSWFGFFSSFFSTFAAAPLVAYIKDDLDLTKKDIGNANVASVAGTIFFRLLMGWICDKLGARRGLAFLLLLTTPAIFGMMFVTSPVGFLMCRLVIGFSLATFVACQVWCAQQFSKSIVGVANATAAGWGNLGGGVTNLTMPFIFIVMMSFSDNDPNTAWRICYLVPLAFHIIGACGVLTARDLPDGNYKELELSGAKQKSDSSIVLKTGVTNVNAWILTITYGFCFGVELTMNNVAALYFYTYHGKTPMIAGVAASMFGMMNLFARSLGGLLSDWAQKKYNMRGRLWACWIIQTLEGIMCLIMGAVTMGLDSPYEQDKVDAWIKLPKEEWRKAQGMPHSWTPISECPNTTVVKKVLKCGTLAKKSDEILRECFAITDNIVLLQDPPMSYLNASTTSDRDCISHSDSFAVIVIIVIIFSVFVQMAEGLHFGIVPYVSRPALGIVSGMVGAGGNLGSVIATSIFFRGAFRTDEGIFNLGIMIIAVTLLMFLVYLPDAKTMGGGGAMLCACGAINYDPQIVKPPADYRGADIMNYDAAASSTKDKTEEGKA